MSDSTLCSATEFINNSNLNINDPFELGYFSISVAYYKQANLERGQGNEALANALQLASDICSMAINPSSPNDPFKAGTTYSNGNTIQRSAIPDDLTSEQLDFIAGVYTDITDPMIRARFADILWLCASPRKVDYAQAAIESYMQLPIDPETWHPDIKQCWERCVQLARQTKDRQKIQNIESILKIAFEKYYSDSHFMNLWLGEMIGHHHLLRDDLTKISEELCGHGINLLNSGNYWQAHDHLAVAEKFFRAQQEDDKWLNCLLLSAECFVLEGDSQVTNNIQGQMAANHSYENALQTYRKVPKAKRSLYAVNEKMVSVRDKIIETGHNILDEMPVFQLPSVDITDTVKASIEHVSDKQDLNHALLYFTAFPSPIYKDLRSQALESHQQYFLSSLFGNIHYSGDGRVTAKTPALGLDYKTEEESEPAIFSKMTQDFQLNIQFMVQGSIVPALNQILMDFRVTKEYLIQLCELSPIVPEGRKYLLASALWSGFEHDFRNSIHLLAPQVEHIVRICLKNNGVHTTTIDKGGIENENGLSTLLKHEQAEEVLGEDLLFELKAVFTESIGANLRNDVAHGLLDDQSSGSQVSVYAWWMILRLVIRSLFDSSTSNVE